MKPYRKISLFAIISSTIIIICNLFFISFGNDLEALSALGMLPTIMGILSGTLSAFNLNFFSYSLDFTYYQWINLAFDLLFFCGGLLYLNKGKRMRILRFTFSVILLSKALTFLSSFFYLPVDAANENLVKDLLFFGYYSLVNLAWIYFSFRVLKYLNGTRELAVVPTEYSTGISNSYVESPNGTRLFHLVIDSVMIILIFSVPMITLFRSNIFGEFFNNMAAAFGPNIFAIFFLFFATAVYYIFFEVIFQASPAKFLSETRVLTVDGRPIDFTKSFARTLSRWIPFNALSFLFSRNGWHDRFSETTVLKEKENSEEKEEITLS
ncbi:hypothetical protein DBR43_10485 [Pedobacter sp. KBW06]|nr:hypothetical protein DBR43_10485 [Pedobacter sp. KBW06]